MLRIAIVGCGKIADQHVQAVHRIGGCGIVAVCDREMLMAGQLAERFEIERHFSDLAEMLAVSKPDVVHITTPPQGHFALASQCLQGGCHVYLEKPFTVTAVEAESLTAQAASSGRKITAGHNYQFTNEMLAMRRLVQKGFLGGKPVHLESHFAYDLGDASYVGPILGSRGHWVRQLPGQLLHNVVSHGVARIVEFLDDELTHIVAVAGQSEKLRSMGGQEVLDELRVLIQDRKGTTAFFSFSTQIKPGINQFRVCGPRNSLTVDIASGTVLRHFNRSWKSYLTYFVPPVLNAWEHLLNAGRNISSFLARKLHQDSGMKELIGRFYESIELSGPPPIPYREIVQTARIMDEIFAQIYADRETLRQYAPATISK
ncbi:MAG: Gfo/Idh/MocA family oxidoreductase [Chthoniobacteraceae bacterium]